MTTIRFTDTQRRLDRLLATQKVYCVYEQDICLMEVRANNADHAIQKYKTLRGIFGPAPLFAEEKK